MTPGDHTNPVEGNAAPPDPAAPAPQGAEQRARLVSRRALVRAGWIVPVVLVVHQPLNASAQILCVSGTTHTDTGDVSLGTHLDVCI